MYDNQYKNQYSELEIPISILQDMQYEKIKKYLVSLKLSDKEYQYRIQELSKYLGV